jgi:hypothetical protein
MNANTLLMFSHSLEGSPNEHPAAQICITMRCGMQRINQSHP